MAPYDAGTGLQYLSAAKELIIEKYRNNNFLNSELFKQRYTVLRYKLESAICAKYISHGLPIYEKADPIGREGLKRIANFLLSKNSTKGYSSRALLVFIFHAIGRVGEAGLFNWKLCQWNEISNSFNTDWQEIKVRKQKPMSFFPDYEGFLICPFHSMAAYLITGGGSHHSIVSNVAESWIFREFCDNTSAKVKDILKECKLGGVLLPLNATAKCLRSGALQEVLDNPWAKLEMAIARGGWDFSGVCALFEYAMGQQQSVDQAGKAIGKWPNIFCPIKAPECIFLNDANEAKFNYLISICFSNAYFAIMESVECSPFGRSLFATLLMYHEEFTSMFPNNEVSKILINNAAQVQLTETDLLELGTQVRNHYRSNNLAQLVPSDSSLRPVMVELLEETSKNRRNNELLNEKVASLQAENKLLIEKVDQMKVTIDKM